MMSHKNGFNDAGRKRNATLSVSFGIAATLLSKGLGLVYRTVFLHVLSAEYLGLNGLFTNVLQLLSLTELGISGVIVYRFYQPVSEHDSETVGRLMNFFKTVYRRIGIIILILGLALMPFVKGFLSDPEQIPSDVNIYLIYTLFLADTVSGYAYSYKQTILSADQREYLKSGCSALVTMAKYIVQIVFLYATHNYTLCLMSGIVVNVSSNFLISIWVTSFYPDIFRVKSGISREEKTGILEDTRATMLHNVGGKVLGATDSIVLTRCVSLGATGLYSNYSLILGTITALLSQLLGSFTSSIGSSNIENSKEKNHEIFQGLLFFNFWIVGLFTVGLMTLLDDFIDVWLGREYVLGVSTCIAVCFQFYLEEIRIIPMTYTNATGLFVRDRYRPLIEAAVNIVVSVALATSYGIPGVFWGTVLSHLCTVSWREPYLLYKYVFRKSSRDYWKEFAIFSVLTLAVCLICIAVKRVSGFQCGSWPDWIAEGIICVILYVVVSCVWLSRRPEFKNMLRRVRSRQIL